MDSRRAPAYRSRVDSVTQAVLGAAIGEVGFRHRLGRRALGFGALCGTLPDFDVLFGLGGELASMVWHRGPTHSLLVIPLLAPAVGWIGHRALGRGRDAGWGVWWHLAFWALMTHPLLDVFTSYGTQLLYPLSDRRFALDGMSIIDPIYTLPLLACVLFALRRVSGPKLRRGTGAALALTTAYCIFGWAMSQRVVSRAEKSLAAVRPDEVRALPVLGTNLAFRTIARTSTAVYVGAAGAFGGGPIRFSEVARGRGPAVERLLNHRPGRVFSWFSGGYWAAEVTPGPSGTSVSLSDLRYGSLLDPEVSLWGIRAQVTPSGEVREVERFRTERDLELGAELSAILRLTQSGAL